MWIEIAVFGNGREHLHSPSARKVWIEISFIAIAKSFVLSPSARKVWIEIYSFCNIAAHKIIHLPRGRCGLKFHQHQNRDKPKESPSARKVWIEIKKTTKYDDCDKSPSARKVWIEISLNNYLKEETKLTFREEGVDWNSYWSCVIEM